MSRALDIVWLVILLGLAAVLTITFVDSLFPKDDE